MTADSQYQLTAWLCSVLMFGAPMLVVADKHSCTLLLCIRGTRTCMVRLHEVTLPSAVVVVASVAYYSNIAGVHRQRYCDAVPGAWQPIAKQEMPDAASIPGRATPRPSGTTTPPSGRPTSRGAADLPSGRTTPRASAGSPSGSSTPRRATAESSSLPAVLPPILDVSTTQRDLAPMLDYKWSGQTTTHVPNVAANQCVDVLLHAVVFAPGMYSLSDYAVSWTYPDLGNLTGAAQGPKVFLAISQQTM